MNKHEKEVVKAQLMSEKQTLRTIQAVYKKALQDIENKLVISNGKINTLLKDVDNLSDEEKSILQSQIYQRKMQRSLKSQLEIMLKDLAVNQYGTVSDYLKASYQNGYIGALYNINMQGTPLILPVDPYLVHRAIEIDSKIKHGLYRNLVGKVDVFKRRIANDISRGIASSASYHDMAAWIRHDTKVSVGKSMRIVRTEGNRVYNAAALDCGKGAKKRGCDLVKVWDSTLDMKTRPTHRECDGQVRELNEDFKNANGEAKAPGQFGIASEDINCRCAVLIKPRWDVDSSFTKRDNETGQLEGFEGVKSYESFKKRYWEEINYKPDNYEQYFRPVEYGKVFDIKRGSIDIEMQPCKTTVNNIAVSSKCNLSRKQLHKLDTNITKAIKNMNITETSNIPKIYVMTHDEMQKNAIASYNAVTNIMAVDKALSESIEEIKLIQKDGACPDNELSTLIHELFHWKDAQEYEKYYGKITKENYSQYITHLNKNRKKVIDKLGINEYNVSRISPYAKDRFKDNDFDEVYTEYRTTQLLR